MKPPPPLPLLLCLMSFGTGLGLMRLKPAGPERGIPPAGRAAAPAGAVTAPSPAAAEAGRPGPVDPGVLPEAALRLAGLESPPSLEDVLAARGLDRVIRMGLFLRSLTDPEELAAALDRCRREEPPDPELLRQIRRRWVEVDLGSALERGGGWRAWAEKDPRAALAAARTPQALAEVTAAIAGSDHAEGARLAGLHPEGATRETWAGVAENLSRTDPAAAAALALGKNLPLDAVVSQWMDRSPDAALAWAKGLADGFDRRRAEAEVLRQLALRDPARAVREAAALPPGRAGVSVFNEALSVLAVRDPEAALKAAAGRPAGNARESAFAVMARGLAATDPDGALKALARISWPKAEISGEIRWSVQFGGDSNVSGDRQDRPGTGPAFGALEELMRAAPERTASALAALPPEAKAPIPQALGAWMGQDPEGASAWLRDQPAGAAKNTGIDFLTRWLVEEAAQPDYGAAVAWAESSTAPGRQALIDWAEEERRVNAEYELAAAAGGPEARVSRDRREWDKTLRRMKKEIQHLTPPAP